MNDHKYLNERWAGHYREHVLEHSAVELARQDINRRLNDMNHMREQINAERGLYPLRSEHDMLVNRLTALETQMAGLVGRISVVAAGAGLLVSITTTIVLKALNI